MHAPVVMKLLPVFAEDTDLWRYLKDVDFEAHNGRGFVETTDNRANAKVFDNVVEAMRYWRTISKTCPRRDDGKPNRPLTAFHPEFERLT